MRLFKSLGHVALLAAFMTGFALPAFADDVAASAKATAVLDRLDAGDFDAATADFNDEMKRALGAGQLQAVQQQIESAGPVQSRDPAQVSQRDGVTVVVIRIHREQASIDATVAVDNAGKVAGLHFAPVAAGG